jgi:putative glutathione S-transferase
MSVVHPHLLAGGWHFVPPDYADTSPAPITAHSSHAFPGSTVDKLYGSKHLAEIYRRADPSYSGKISVPVLWDTKEETIVNNESADILRNLNTAFNSLLPEEKAKIDLYPESLQSEIDEVNDWIGKDLNIGVYKAGFATSQSAYDDGVRGVTVAMDRVEKRLDGRTYLVGQAMTEADVR